MSRQNFSEIPQAPKGVKRLYWLGPAFIWMLSAAGSGELLFTPRIAAQYGYTLIWAMLLAVIMKWFINREIGRYTVCTGATFFQGIASLKNKGWLLWLILVPQLIVAVATVAGLAGASSTAVVVILNVPLWVPAVSITIITAIVISLQAFRKLEKTTTILAIVISLSILAAAIAAKPDMQELSRGFVPTLAKDVKVDEVLSWVGFMLAGAAGLMWFSYWTAARGYGAASLKRDRPLNLENADEGVRSNLKKWITHVTIANTLAVIGALIIGFAFLILGTELLKPQQLVPGENQVASTLGKLMGGIWGEVGFWFMIVAVFITFTSTLLSDQDGFGRMFADGVVLLTSTSGKTGRWVDKQFIKKVFIWAFLVVIPLGAYLIAGEPVGLLKLAALIEASHIPVVAGIILYLNKKQLPRILQPSVPVFVCTIIAGLFFAVFASIYIVRTVF